MSDHHHDDPIQVAIKQSVAQAVTHPSFIQSILAAVQEQVGMSIIGNAERMRPVMLAEAVVPPEAYNERGDTVMLLRRRLRNIDNAFNVIITFTQGDDNNVTYVTTIYKDHPFDTLNTSFIEMTDPAALAELNRQIAALYKPDFANKSVQLVMMTCPELLKEKPQEQQPEPEPHPQPIQQPSYDNGDFKYDEQVMSGDPVSPVMAVSRF